MIINSNGYMIDMGSLFLSISDKKNEWMKGVEGVDEGVDASKQ